MTTTNRVKQTAKNKQYKTNNTEETQCELTIDRVRGGETKLHVVSLSQAHNGRRGGAREAQVVLHHAAHDELEEKKEEKRIKKEEKRKKKEERRKQ